MTFTIVDSLPLPRIYTGTAIELEIVQRALRLTATGPEMNQFWREVAPRLGFDTSVHTPVEDAEQRRLLRAELDVLVARDLYGLSCDEMRYLLNPADILGPEVGFETFGALKRADEREFGGRFLTRDLVLETWDRLPASVEEDHPADHHTMAAGRARSVEASLTAATRIPPSSRPDADWTRPAAADAAALRLQTRAQVAAIINALNGPTPAREVRLAALFALEPRFLTPRLSGAERAHWRRVVGAEADPPADGVVAFGLGGASGWGEALQQLEASHSLIIDSAQDTWTQGPGLNAYMVIGWTERAGFALDIANRILSDRSATLTADESNGLAILAA